MTSSSGAVLDYLHCPPTSRPCLQRTRKPEVLVHKTLTHHFLAGADGAEFYQYLKDSPPTHLRVHSEGESAPGDALLGDDHRSDAIRPTSMTARRATFGRP